MESRGPQRHRPVQQRGLGADLIAAQPIGTELSDGQSTGNAIGGARKIESAGPVPLLELRIENDVETGRVAQADLRRDSAAVQFTQRWLGQRQGQIEAIDARRLMVGE